MADKIRYGGQAVMEGVMMRGTKSIATVVRRPDGTLAKSVHPLHPIYTGRWRKMPLVRGDIAMLEATVLGAEALMFSTGIALEEPSDEKPETEEKKGSSGGPMIWIMLLLSMALAVCMFSLLPLFLTRWILPGMQGSLAFNLLEGVLRLGIFLIYLRAVSFMPDIRRTFAYHGAEHKTIHAYEAGVELTPENVQKHTTAHARCGTAFLLAVMLIAILIFSIVGELSWWWLLASRILLLPVIAAIAYEVTQWAARHEKNLLAKIMIAPGMWLQRLSTRHPDDQMVEVAITALKEVLIADGVIPAETPVAPPEAAG
ncbi:MAG: DUF1385 domain-containing protein [Dehalococcoidia bacterium]|nr:DUF1385 domain-containing protein [Dehalococcoidia bacterium]